MVFPDDEAKLRAGRLSNEERLIILEELGKVAQEKYNDILSSNHRGYNLSLLQGSLQFRPDIKTFDNDYWIETGSDELNKIASYFEYGTGLFNSKTKSSARKYITPVTSEYMRFIAKDGNLVFAKQTRGVKPIFMMTKAVQHVAFNRPYIQRQIRIREGI